jgi:hypothetical protein
VDETITCDKRIFPPNKEYPEPEHIGIPPEIPNYPSATEHIDEVLKTYEEEKLLGMTEGPFTREQLVKRLGTEDYHVLPLGAKQESDKLRNIQDGRKAGLTERIRPNTLYRTENPGLQDALHIMQILQQQTKENHQLQPAILKYDYSKAHRRMKVLPKDHKRQIVQIKGAYWINKCGTYGVASAQYIWARMGAFLQRRIHTIILTEDNYWALLYVDDTIAFIKVTQFWTISTLTLLFLEVLGAPIKWAKTEAGARLPWIGFTIDIKDYTTGIHHTKHKEILALQDKVKQGETITYKDLSKYLHKLSWAIQAHITLRPFLYPYHGWFNRLDRNKQPPSYHTHHRWPSSQTHSYFPTS